VSSGDLPVAELEKLSDEQRMGEWVMLRLRLSEGIEFDAFAERWGCDARNIYGDEIGRLGKLGLIEGRTERFVLSEAGLAVADAIAGEFLRG